MHEQGETYSDVLESRGDAVGQTKGDAARDVLDDLGDRVVRHEKGVDLAQDAESTLVNSYFGI